MEKEPRKPQTLALAPVLILRPFYCRFRRTGDDFRPTPMVVTAADKAPPGTTGMARPHRARTAIIAPENAGFRTEIGPVLPRNSLANTPESL
jgi:hypothetical protein